MWSLAFKAIKGWLGGTAVTYLPWILVLILGVLTSFQWIDGKRIKAECFAARVVMDNVDLGHVIEDIGVVNEIVEDVNALPVNDVVKQLRHGGWIVESSDKPKSKDH